MNSGTTEAQDRASLYFKRHPDLLGQNDFSWFIYQLWGRGVPCIQMGQLAGDWVQLGPYVVLSEDLLLALRPSVFRWRPHTHGVALADRAWWWRPPDFME